jgi:hypothetical protein
MKRTALTLALSILPLVVAYAALLGLGMHRHGSPWAISAAATLILFGPPMAVAAASTRSQRTFRMGLAAGAWALLLWTVLPVYFPGERRDAVASGLALLGGDALARSIADGLPGEPLVSRPELPPATVAVDQPLPPATPLSDAEIALPYEGEGRRLAVPVVLDHGGESTEVYMMLDTGATYTTLSIAMLKKLGVELPDDSPVIRLHTANGERDAKVALLDRIWLGDLAIDGIAIATCDPCASTETVGLLGLNVSGGFNLTIDADRREVVFTSRKAHDRHLDIKPFTDLDATFTRYPGGRVEVEVSLANHGPRTINEAVASIRCGDISWQVSIDAVIPDSEVTTRRRLPEHTGCDQYEISLESAHW